MRLQKNINLTQFLQVVDKCEGDVFCRTKEKDCLNLKSTLTRFIFVTLIESPDLLYSSSVECENTNDYERLKEYLVLK